MNRVQPHALVLMLTLSACTCGGDPDLPPGIDEHGEPTQGDRETEATTTPEAASLREYFPSHPGDRWRFHNGNDRITRVVTASDEDLIIVVGEDLTSPLRLRITDDAVSMLDFEGRPAGNVLETPIELDHGWRYTLGDAECEARYTAVDEEYEVAGLTLNACLVVRRRCLHPAGKPFPEQTYERHVETYCPFVGRVREQMQIDTGTADEPQRELREGFPRRDDRLVFYRVQDAPAPLRSEVDACDSFLLAQSDMQAACGPLVRHGTTETADNRECRLTFAHDPSVIHVVMRALPEDQDGATHERIMPVVGSEEEPLVVAGPGFRIELLSAETPCSDQALMRLEPLLRSLVRD